MRRKKIIISCGGTGGHIFPALEIADSIQNQSQDIDILFVGATGKMEMKKVPDHGYSIKGIWMQGYYRKSFFKNLLLPIKIVVSLIHSLFIILYYKPIVVIGTGGFASGPIVFVASLLHIKTFIQEQNAYPGFTNKLLSRYVDKIFVAHKKMDVFFPKHKLLHLGNPVRHSLKINKSFQKKSRSFFHLKKDVFTILVIGGSLGATPINNFIKKNLTLLFNKDCQLIWQTGSKDYAKCISFSSGLCSIHKFISRMDLAYNASDIVISRAGAIAISELCFLSKASILIPSPYVTDNHQFKNAKYLEQNLACLMVEENQLEDKLLNCIIKMKNSSYKEKLGVNANSLFRYNSALEIAKIILQDIMIN